MPDSVMRARRAKAASIRASRRRARAYRTGGHCNARERRRGRARDRRWICSFTIAPREGFGAQSTLLGQLARVGKDDLRFPLVIADLPRHTDPLAKKRSLGGPEFRSIIHVHDGGENGILEMASQGPATSAAIERRLRIRRKPPHRRQSPFLRCDLPHPRGASSPRQPNRPIIRLPPPWRVTFLGSWRFPASTNADPTVASPLFWPAPAYGDRSTTW
jgi:hypothetical protein